MEMKKKQGFTLIEVLMIVFIMGIVAVIGGNMLFSIMKGTSKAEITKEVKQNGDYAMAVMERLVRSAQNCSSAGGVTITNPDGRTTRFFCEAVSGVTRIASNSGVFLTGDNVTASNCIFSCDSTKTPPIVSISFDLSQKGTDLRPEEKAQIHFQRTVSLRTY